MVWMGFTSILKTNNFLVGRYLDVNLFLNKPWFLCVWCPSLLKASILMSVLFSLALGLGSEVSFQRSFPRKSPVIRERIDVQSNFTFQPREYLCNITYDLYHGYFLNKDWYPTDICRTWMHFLRVNVTFYDEVAVIYDVTTTAKSFPYTTKFMFVCVKNNKTQQNRRWKINRIRT